MNLKRLEYFATLANTGNMGKASEMLHISTPALSKAMKVLEEELETKLWIKNGRNIILTDAGMALLKQTPSFIENIKNLKDSLQPKFEKKEVLRIGSFESFSTYFLTFLNELKWNDCVLELHEMLPGQIEKYITEGQIDIGISFLPIPNSNLDFLKVTEIEMGVFTRVNSFEGLHQKELPYVVPIMPLEGIPSKVRGLDGWPEDAYQRKILHKVTLMESALELCRQGRVAGYFPTFIVHEHNKRVKKEFQLERRKSLIGRICKNDVYIVKRKSMEETPTIKRLAKALRLICNQ